MNEHVTFVLLLAVISLAVSTIAFGVKVKRMERRLSELEMSEYFQMTPLFEAVRHRCRRCKADDDVVLMAGCWWTETDLCSSCADDDACSLSRGEVS